MSDFVRTSPGRNPDDRDARGVDLVDDDARPSVRILVRGALPSVLEHGGRIWVATGDTHDGAGGPPIAVYRPQT
ncbi:hypothetical protein ITJ58_17820 [Curtobacterium flaccumfaciens]|uniref:hypothetical protein n=1 Tax=Curtobacterium flaccumfaciens TaxID=2035 RepID=UPI00188C6D0E|nr:hypothetical protein [Curtobacterium flaccumfaciens]MBF4595624.1 hypothetical protein [Curtobacterium flaccumfaciens]